MSLLTPLALAATMGTAAAPSAPIAHQTLVHGKAKYHVVIADLNSGALAPIAVMPGGYQTAWTMIGQKQPIAAITGTFFAPSAGVPVADVLVDGKLVAKGNRGSGVAVSELGEVQIFDRRFKHSMDWSNYKHGLRGAVRVVSNGTVNPNPQAQKFKDRRIWGSAARTGIGLTKHNKLVMIATEDKVTLSQLGWAMVKSGVVNGISLDGGSSTCLYYNGRMLISPERKLVNMFALTVVPPEMRLAKANPATQPPLTIAATRPQTPGS